MRPWERMWVFQMVKSWGNDDESHPPDMKYSTYSPPKCIDPRHSNTKPGLFYGCIQYGDAPLDGMEYPIFRQNHVNSGFS